MREEEKQKRRTIADDDVFGCIQSCLITCSYFLRAKLIAKGKPIFLQRLHFSLHLPCLLLLSLAFDCFPLFASCFYFCTSIRQCLFPIYIFAVNKCESVKKVEITAAHIAIRCKSWHHLIYSHTNWYNTHPKLCVILWSQFYAKTYAMLFITL